LINFTSFCVGVNTGEFVGKIVESCLGDKVDGEFKEGIKGKGETEKSVEVMKGGE
jgi:hypothetical protein